MGPPRKIYNTAPPGGRFPAPSILDTARTGLDRHQAGLDYFLGAACAGAGG